MVNEKGEKTVKLPKLHMEAKAISVADIVNDFSSKLTKPLKITTDTKPAKTIDHGSHAHAASSKDSKTTKLHEGHRSHQAFFEPQWTGTHLAVRSNSRSVMSF